jgi:hypothetical protein
MGEVINAYKILVAKPEGKISLGRRRRRCEVNVRMHLKDIIGVAQSVQGLVTGWTIESGV